uniref:Secreted protein n=1 Tax=Caenorhabditis tropicalis TaxID=1561998 RepID=A0A1I7U9Z0_9PELO
MNFRCAVTILSLDTPMFTTSTSIPCFLSASHMYERTEKVVGYGSFERGPTQSYSFSVLNPSRFARS